MLHCNIKRTAIFIVVLYTISLFCSCHISDKYDYYSNIDNYITAVGTVVRVWENQKHDTLYLELADISPTFDDVCFKIEGKNLELLQETGSIKRLCEGIQIEFVTAPKYFGDGYVYPIVSISVDGDILLEFEDGFQNNLRWINP